MLRVLFFLYFSQFCVLHAQESTLTIGLPVVIASIHPASMKMSVEGYVIRFIGRSLINQDENGQFTADLAQTIPKLEMTSDGLGSVVTFSIRENAKWGDGKPVICNDVFLGIRLNFASIGKVNRVKLTSSDSKNCTLEYKEKMRFYDLIFIPPPIRSSLEEKIFVDAKFDFEKYIQKSSYTKNITQAALSNGPYILAEHKRGEYVIFKKNKHWWGTKAHLDKIILRFYSNSQSLFNAFVTNEVDLVSSEAFDTTRLNDFKEHIKKTGDHRILENVATLNQHLFFNTALPPFQDLNLRKVVSNLISNKDLDNLMEGSLVQTRSLLHPKSDFYFSEYREPFTSKTREARNLMIRAGYLKNPQGKWTKDGQLVSFELLTASDRPERMKLATYFSEVFNSFGFEVSVKAFPLQILSTVKFKEKFKGIGIMAWYLPLGMLPKQFFLETEIPEVNEHGVNFSRWKSSEVQNILKEIDALETTEDIKNKYSNFLKQYYVDLPWITLGFSKAYSIVPKDLKNYRIKSDFLNDSTNAEDWIRQAQ